jgi:hypothetical protein
MRNNKPLSKKSILPSLSMILLLQYGLQAQEQQIPLPDPEQKNVYPQSFNALGGNASGNGGSVSYSVGQLVYTMEQSESGSVSQGVQRPYRLVSAEIPPSAPVLRFQVLPNPTDGDLLLRLNEKPEENPDFRVTDLQGRNLLEGKVQFPDTQVQLSGFPSGTYLIQVHDSKKQRIQTLQIIKN